MMLLRQISDPIIFLSEQFPSEFDYVPDFPGHCLSYLFSSVTTTITNTLTLTNTKPRKQVARLRDQEGSQYILLS